MSELVSDLESLILYEDEEIIVINKPSGLLTIRDGYHPELPNLQSILSTRYAKLWTVHRLDKETSGAIIFAKSADVHRCLNKQFDDRLISKGYHAIVNGIPVWEEKTIDSHLIVNGDRKHRTVVHSKGKIAVTSVRVVSIYKGLSYLVVEPKTGYTHQIRAHLASVGFSILGDSLYTPVAERVLSVDIRNNIQNIDSSRLYLHARSINFTHPSNGEPVTVTAPFDSQFLTVRQLFLLFV